MQTPDGMQRLLDRADWDADGVRDDLRDYVVEHLGDPDGVLIVDETGFLKKGSKSAGVAAAVLRHRRADRELPGRRVPGLRAPRAGGPCIDRELYLPKAWTDDRGRCAAAGIARRGASSRPSRSWPWRCSARALDAGVPAGWVTGDEVYGQHSGLRLALEERGMGYVLAVPSNQHVIATIDDRPADIRVDALAAALPDAAWKRLSGGARCQGTAALRLGPRARSARWHRSRVGTGCWSAAASPTRRTGLLPVLRPARPPLEELVRVAGRRWAIEESFQTAKNEVGLDHYQVRRYDAWYRHITLACWPTPSWPSPAPPERRKGGRGTCAGS